MVRFTSEQQSAPHLHTPPVNTGVKNKVRQGWENKNIAFGFMATGIIFHLKLSASRVVEPSLQSSFVFLLLKIIIVTSREMPQKEKGPNFR